MSVADSSRWPVEIDGRSFQPIPESWITAGRDLGTPGKRLYAVSAALTTNEKFLYLRYGHPASGEVLLAKTGAAQNSAGDGHIPGGLARGTGWPRSKTPHPEVEPAEPLRDPEWDHFRTLWGDRLDVLQTGERDNEPELVTDGGVARPVDDGAKYTGVDPQRYLPELEFTLSTVRADPLTSTVSSREIADVLNLRPSQATAVLQEAEDRGLVERWSARSQHRNPKWLVVSEVRG